MARAKKPTPDTLTPLANAVGSDAVQPATGPKYTPAQVLLLNQFAMTLLAGTPHDLHPGALKGRAEQAFAAAIVILEVSEAFTNG